MREVNIRDLRDLPHGTVYSVRSEGGPVRELKIKRPFDSYISLNRTKYDPTGPEPDLRERSEYTGGRTQFLVWERSDLMAIMDILLGAMKTVEEFEQIPPTMKGDSNV